MADIQEGVKSFLNGLRDSLSGIVPIVMLAQGNEKLRVPLFRCILLNGIILMVSVIAFEWLLLPLIEGFVSIIYGLLYSTDSTVASEFGAVLWYLFAGLWVLPLFWISKPLNAFWFQDIANEAFKKRSMEKHGPHSKERRKRQNTQTTGKQSVVYVVADILFSLAMDMIFMLQATVVRFLPVVGTPLSVLHQIFLISLYAFEYRCYSEDLANCRKRIQVVESNWPYFVGFGTPITLLMLLPQYYVVSACVFALLFPVTIVSAYEARHIDFATASTSAPLKVPMFHLAARMANSVTDFLLHWILGLRVTSTGPAPHQVGGRDSSMVS